ncbi:MAG: bifunctional DNA primase/polymerase [Pyrinomonadaceae bacterium]
MNGAPLRAIAAEYAAQGLSTIVASPRSKVPLVEWKAYQYEPPSSPEREAMFSFEQDLNIGVVCGAASSNLAIIDAESKPSFTDQLKQCDRAGLANTWVDETYRGGHIYLSLPVAVKPRSFKRDGYEVRAQGQFVLMPPSVHPSGAVYRFINRPPSIIRVPSLDALDWLGLQPAGKKKIPRKARSLLQGDPHHQYESRSEAEQAIITVLFNAGFCFDEMLALFKSCPAAGKFREIDTAKGAMAATL